MPSWLHDIRLAARSLIRRPGFTALAMATIAIGIGSSATVFSIVHGVLLQPLPFAEPDELVMIWSHRTEGERARSFVSQPDVESLRDGWFLDAVEGVATADVPLTGVDTPEQVPAALVTSGLMELLGVEPVAGRDLGHADNERDAPRVAVVSHAFWQTRLGGVAGVIGSSIHLFEEPYEVVGIAPPGFDHPDASHLWLPRRLDTDRCGRGCPIYRGAVARLADGLTLEAAQIEATAVAVRASSAFPDAEPAGKDFWIESLLDYEVGDVRRGLWITFGAVGLVLLIVCANTTNLLLVRGAGRVREVAIRSALGASAGRLALPVAAEVFLLAVGGGVLGLLLSLGTLQWIQAMATERIPRLGDVSLDAPAFAFLLGITAVVAMAVGLVPALRLVRHGQADRLRARQRGFAGHGGRGRPVIVAAEVALSVVALVGAGLLVRSLGELHDVDMGFDGERVTRFSLVPPSTRYPEFSDRVELFTRVEEAMASLSGVERVGAVFGAPLTNDGTGVEVSIDGSGREAEVAYFRPATEGYFEAMRIPVLRGSGLSDANGEPVAVIDEAATRSIFGPDEDPIGRSITMTGILGTVSARVVGIVPAVRRAPNEPPPAPAVYPLYDEVGFGPGGLTFHVRTAPGSGDILSSIRAEVARIDSGLILLRPGTVTAAVRSATARTRFFMALLLAAAGIAVLLVAIGLYGVVAFMVARSTSEIGLRMALGADRAGVARLFILRGLRPTLVGLAGGLAVAALAGHTLEALLFGVTPWDPLVLVLVTSIVLVITTAAVLVPALRATRVDPSSSLAVE